MAKLSVTAEERTALPEAQQADYVEGAGGKFYLKLEGDPEEHPSVAEKVAGLKTKNADLVAREKVAKDKLAEYKGADPAKILELVAKAEEAERERLKAEGNFDAREQQVRTHYDTNVVAPLQKRVDKAVATLDKKFVKSELLEAAEKHGFFGNLLQKQVSDQVKLVETDDGYVVKVYNADGNTVRINAATGHDMTVDEFVAECANKDEFKPLKKPSGGKGSGGGDGGVTTETQTTGAPTKAELSKFTVQQKVAFIAEHGQVLWNKILFGQ